MTKIPVFFKKKNNLKLHILVSILLICLYQINFISCSEENKHIDKIEDNTESNNELLSDEEKYKRETLKSCTSLIKVRLAKDMVNKT